MKKHFGLLICALCIIKLSYAQQQINLSSIVDSVYYFEDKRDNNEYKALVINGTTWLGESLRYKTPDSRCYNNRRKNCVSFGRLYRWDEAVIACPKGWQLPTNKQWDSLLNLFGGIKTAGIVFAQDSIGFKVEFGYPPNIYGRYAEEDTEIHFWSNDIYNKNTVWNYYLIKDKLPLVYNSYLSKNYYLNCLCVKNE